MSTDLVVLHGTLNDDMDFARMVVAQPDRGAQSILPDSYKGNPANVLIAVGLGQSMGLSRAESLYRIAIIKGKPTAGAELIASNVRKAGHRLRVTGTDDTCTATIVRADDPDFEFSITRDIAWARSMGLATNDNYKKQAGTMLQWRAITAVARLACPESLYGVIYSSDEMFDTDGPSAPTPAKRGGMAGLRDAVASTEPVEYVAEVVEPTEPTAPEPATDDTTDVLTAKQLKAIHAGMGQAGLGERTAGLAFLTEVLGRDVDTSKTLSKADAGKVPDQLAEINQGATETPEPEWT